MLTLFESDFQDEDCICKNPLGIACIRSMPSYVINTIPRRSARFLIVLYHVRLDHHRHAARERLVGSGPRRPAALPRIGGRYPPP